MPFITRKSTLTDGSDVFAVVFEERGSAIIVSEPPTGAVATLMTECLNRLRNQFEATGSDMEAHTLYGSLIRHLPPPGIDKENLPPLMWPGFPIEERADAPWTINEKGIKEIKEFLNKYDRYSQVNKATDAYAGLWATNAEAQLRAGLPPTITILGQHCVTGSSKSYTISDEGITAPPKA